MNQLHKIALAIALGFALLGTGYSAAQGESTPTLAEPTQYKTLPESKLGRNEAGKGLQKGERVKGATLKTIDGEDYALASAWAERPALVVFYRGGWCPYCNGQVRELAVNYPKLKAAGVQPVLISVDAPDKTAALSRQYEIPFPVLSDPDLLAHRQFNVLLELDQNTLKKYRDYGIDLSAWSGRQHNTIAVASVFVIDQQGRVLASHATADYAERPSIEQLLTLIDTSLNQ